MQHIYICPVGSCEIMQLRNVDYILNSCSFFFFYFPGGSDGKVSAYNAGDLGSIPGSGRSPGEGNDNPLQYSCLENLMDRRTW